MDVSQMTPSAVIINPRAGRGRGKGLALAAQLRDDKAIEITILEKFENLFPALQNVATKGTERLFISSGDGTIHAIQSWLGENLSQAKQPQLCLLPHGTTNMTAADLGFRNRNIAQQATFIRGTTAKEVRSRHTVRVVNPRDRAPLHGMFFGTGAIPKATRYCQLAFNDKGVGGNWATFATLAKAVGKTILTKPDPDDINRFDRPHAIELAIDGKVICKGPQLLMLATTLNKLILNSKPFWDGATSPLRTTVVPYPVPNPLRWALPALFGSETRRAPPGATSIACTSCEVTSDTEFVIDGEFYNAPENEPLRIETGPLFQYLIA
jgi:diacylglycerol kinase (ATP)